KISSDLKQRIADMYLKDGMKMAEIAKLQSVSIGLVSTVVNRVRKYGGVENPFAQPTGAKPVLNDEDRDFLRALNEANSMLYLNEIQEKLLSIRNVSVSLATICRELKKMCLVRKKVSKAAVERDDELR
ncbi:hypothetical protein C8F01DRAFT_924542, partial [Mycena amicta]